MKRLVAFGIILFFVAVLVLAGMYFYNQYSILYENPMKAVPSDAAFIVEAHNPSESLKSFFTSELSSELKQNQWFSSASSDFHFIDSLIAENPKANEIWKKQSLVISAHLTQAERYGILYLINLPRGWDERKLKNFISSVIGKNSFSEREYLSVNIYEMQVNDSVSLTFASHGSIAMFSFTSVLVEQSLRQINSGNSVVDRRAFRKVKIPDRKKGEINMYVSYPMLRDFASSLSNNNNPVFYSMAGVFAKWSGLNTSAESSGMMLEGKTSATDSTDMMSILRFQQPTALNASSIAPLRTAMMVQFGLSDAKDFIARLNRQALYAVEERDKKLAVLEKTYRFHAEEHFLSWVGNEIAVIVTEPSGNLIDNNLYACIKTFNATEALNHLNTLKAAVEKYTGVQRKIEKYHDYLISSVPVKGIVPMMYGKMFSAINNCYYTSIRDYIVFANQSSSLKDLIDEYDDGKVLEKEPAYRSAIAHFSSAANVAFYLSPQRAANISGSSSINSFISALSLSTGIHARWTNSGADINTQVYFDFRRKELKEPVLLFSTQLDTTLAITPVIATDDTQQPFVFVQDENRNLYKIDFSGNIQWKKVWDEKIHSGIKVVDFYHDGRSQLLFNTDSKLYLVDMNGEDVGNYPIKLPAPASNACMVSKGNIFIACKNHYTYGYQLNGKPLYDWNYFRTNTEVAKPLQSFSFDNSEFVAINEAHDAVTFIDRKGAKQISYRDKFVEALNSSIFFVSNDSINGPHFITTDTLGRIVQLNPGSVAEIKFEIPAKKFSAQHSFVFADIDGDGKEDWIFLDGNMLTAFHENGSLLFESKLPNGLSNSIYQFNVDGTANLFVVSPASNKIYLLNRSGSVSKGFPLKGCLYPSFEMVNMRKVLITGSNDFTLQVYELKSQ